MPPRRNRSAGAGHVARWNADRRPVSGDSDGTAGPKGPVGRPARDLPSPLWLVRNHPRLFGSIALSVAAFVVLTLASPHTRMSTRLLLAWDAGVLVYVVLAFTAMSHFDLALVRRQ